MPSRDQIYSVPLEQFTGYGCLNLIDTQIEVENEVGRSYPFAPMERGECILHSKVQEDHDI